MIQQMKSKVKKETFVERMLIQLRNIDIFAPNIISELHIDNNFDQKTYIGGGLTILVRLIFGIFVVGNFVKMIQR